MDSVSRASKPVKLMDLTVKGVIFTGFFATTLFNTINRISLSYALAAGFGYLPGFRAIAAGDDLVEFISTESKGKLA